MRDFRGSADAGGSELTMIEWDEGRPVRLKGDWVPDEIEQANYLIALLDIFDEAGIDSAFVYTFARYDLPHRSNSAEDFDLASRGIVRVFEGNARGDRYPEMAWEPKAAFDALANRYRR